MKDIETAVLEEVQQMFPEVKKDSTLAGMLFNVTEATGEKFIMIIDEWDALFREAKDDAKLQKNYIDLLRSLFKSSWTDMIFEGAYMTGILPIKKYGTQSALTDFKEYTMTQPETYESLRFYIELNKDGLKEAITQMLGGAQIKIDVATFQNDMTTMKSRDDVLTLLVHLGYLVYDMESKSVVIPNEELREEFIRAVTTGRYTEIARLIRNSDQLLEATLNMDEDAVAAVIEEAHKAGTAPTFYNNEQALRSVIRVAYISCVDEF